MSVAYLDDRGVLLASLFELVKSQPSVFVQIHDPEDLVDSLHDASATTLYCQDPALKTHLLRGILVLGQSDHLSRHLVYRSHNLQHLIVGDIPVLVDIVQLERPWDMSVEAKALDGITATAPAGPCYSHLSFSSSRPREVTERAQINSLNSIVPDLSSSNTLKT